MKATPNEIDQKLKDANYKFLGWQNGWESIMLDEHGNETSDYRQYRKHGGYKNQPQHENCVKNNHTRDSVSHNNRGSENTVSCDICKIYWKYDCSD